jgi:hypothetical protein
VPNPRLLKREPDAQGIEAADNLWIQAGKMSGPPDHRHQIEFAGDLVGFFIQPIRGSEYIPIRLPARSEVLWRPLTARGTDYGQWTEIWRLGLPTPLMGGPTYVDRAIKFTRRLTSDVIDGVHVVFDLEVEDDDSSIAASWRTLADTSGVTGQTGGGQKRAFGWWS